VFRGVHLSDQRPAGARPLFAGVPAVAVPAIPRCDDVEPLVAAQAELDRDRLAGPRPTVRRCPTTRSRNCSRAAWACRTVIRGCGPASPCAAAEDAVHERGLVHDHRPCCQVAVHPRPHLQHSHALRTHRALPCDRPRVAVVAAAQARRAMHRPSLTLCSRGLPEIVARKPPHRTSSRSIGRSRYSCCW
jgi:hypothetical protein